MRITARRNSSERLKKTTACSSAVCKYVVLVHGEINCSCVGRGTAWTSMSDGHEIPTQHCTPAPPRFLSWLTRNRASTHLDVFLCPAECAIRVAPHEDGPGTAAPGSPVGMARETHGTAAPEAQGALPHISASANGKQGASRVDDAPNLTVRRSASVDETADVSPPSCLAVVSRSRTCRRKDAAEAKADAAGPRSPGAPSEDEPIIVSDSGAEANTSDVAWICQICARAGADYVSGSIDP